MAKSPTQGGRLRNRKRFFCLYCFYFHGLLVVSVTAVTLLRFWNNQEPKLCLLLFSCGRNNWTSSNDFLSQASKNSFEELSRYFVSCFVYFLQSLRDSHPVFSWKYLQSIVPSHYPACVKVTHFTAQLSFHGPEVVLKSIMKFWAYPRWSRHSPAAEGDFD